MDHKLVLENSNSAAVYTLPNTIIYLKTIKYLNIRLRQIYYADLELKIGRCKRFKIECCTMAKRIRDYCVGN